MLFICYLGTNRVQMVTPESHRLPKQRMSDTESQNVNRSEQPLCLHKQHVIKRFACRLFLPCDVSVSNIAHT